MSFTITDCQCSSTKAEMEYSIIKLCKHGGAKGQLHCTLGELLELRELINEKLLEESKKILSETFMQFEVGLQ